MRRERDDNSAAAGTAFDRQLSAAAACLREDGVPPAHDLWPGISLALDKAEAGGARPGRRRPARRWAQAALAASVLLAVGLGLSGWQPGGSPGTARGPQPAPGSGDQAAASPTGPAATRQGLRAVEAALDEVQAALAQSPDDPELSRLVRLIHHSRGRLLRLQAEGGARDARRGPA